MAAFQHPLQCIQFVRTKSSTTKNVLVASAGAQLISYAAESGERLSSWPRGAVDQSAAQPNPEAAGEAEAEGPPGKRRKVSSDEGKNGATAKQKTPWTNIPIVTATPDEEYLVVLTGEDKNIRVFQLEEDGSFQQLSERPMPKRPCAITFMESNDILTGDKFGDVYSMPLLPGSEPTPGTKSKAAKAQIDRATRIAATNLTVHTKRNLKSLEMQNENRSRAEAEKAKKQTEKENDKPVFDHDLLLGHVSLLTDVAFASLPSPDSPDGKRRDYILSADRDEHIRVSRGRPQAHVIETNCLGHTSFISKLCVPEWAPEFLISGGGDPHLLVWNWTAGEVLHTVPLFDSSTGEKEVAVRGIWTSGGTDAQRIIFVGLEGTPTLIPFTLETNGSMTAHQPITASGNILDVQVRSKMDTTTVIVSVDTIREPSSIQDWRSSPSSILLEAFQAKQGQTEWESVTGVLVNGLNATGSSSVSLTAGAEQKEKSALNTSLYTLENLRKKQYDEEANL